MRRFLATAVSAIVCVYCWIWLVGLIAVLLPLTYVLERFRGRRAWTDMLHLWARLALRVGFYRGSVRGSDVAGPAIIVSNHISAFDIALLAATIPPPVYFMARADLLKIPIVGSALRRGKHVIVGGSSGLNDTVRQVRERIESGGRVIVFAEGTRSHDDRVRPFARGPFRLAHLVDCDLVPVAVAGTDQAIAKGSRLIRSCRLGIRFLEPRRLTSDQADSKTYREAVRQDVAAAADQLRREIGAPADGAYEPAMHSVSDNP